VHNENELPVDEQSELLADLDSIDSERAERSASKSTPARRKQRALYMSRYRKLKNDPQIRLEQSWAANLSQLSEDERKRLLDAADEVSFLNHLMHLVDRGVSFCGRGVGTVHVDYPDPNEVSEEVKAWLNAGNTFVHSSFPRSMAGLFESDLQKLDDPEFIKYGLKTHITFSIWEHFLSNLSKFNRRQSGKSIAPANASHVQVEGLTQTAKQEAALLEKEIRKQVGVL
jgi:hypothetical protein